MVEKTSAFSEANPPAFPRNYDADGHNGLSLRDWFASGIASALCTATDNTGMWTGLIDDDSGYAMVAQRAYRMADALLAERQKGGEA